MMSWKQSGEGRRRRKRHEPLPSEAPDEPFGPPPEEYRYRCPVCGEEMLVKEAIIAVAVGAAQFRGEYTGGCSPRRLSNRAIIPPLHWSVRLGGENASRLRGAAMGAQRMVSRRSCSMRARSLGYVAHCA